MLVLLAKILVVLLFIIIIRKKLLKPSSVCIDNTVFRLHYKTTTTVLLVCCLLVTSEQFIGDPIACFVDGDKKASSGMHAFCWIQSNFTVSTRTLIDEQISNPDVVTPEKGDELKYHKSFHRWMDFMFVLQAMLFFFPHWLWKTWESGRFKMLVNDLQSPLMAKETRHRQLTRITDYFEAILHYWNFVALFFFCCEVLNFVNVVAQICFMYQLLGYEFTMYGPRTHVFPKEINCMFQEKSCHCLLSVSITNERICVGLWFWFIVLAVVTGLTLLYRLAMLLSPQRRLHLLLERTRLTPGEPVEEEVAVVARKCKMGDWWFLCQMGENMNPIAFNEFIGILSQRLSG